MMKNWVFFVALMIFAMFHKVVCETLREDNITRSNWHLQNKESLATNCCTTDKSENWKVSTKQTTFAKVSTTKASKIDGHEIGKSSPKDSYRSTVLPHGKDQNEVSETTTESQDISDLEKGFHISDPSPEQKDSNNMTTADEFASVNDEKSLQNSTSQTAISVTTTFDFVTNSPTKPDPATAKIRTGNRRQTEKSCKRHCGQPKDLLTGCDCDPQCYVYKTCCQDIAEFCPHVEKNAAAFFGPFLMGVSPRCDGMTNLLTIDMCPNGWAQSNDKGDSAHQEVPTEDRSGTRVFFQNIRNQISVFDRYTGLLFENMTVYNCNAKNESIPELSRAVVEVDLTTETSSPADLKELLQKSKNVVFIPGNHEAAMRTCKQDEMKTPPFAIAMDFSTEHQISVSPYGMRAMVAFFWQQATCSESSLGLCEHTSCRNGLIVSGKCTIFQYSRFLLAHPPFKHFHEAEVEKFALFAKCAFEILKKQINVQVDGIEVSTNIDGIELVGRDIPSLFPLPPNAMSPNWTYFRIDLNATLTDSTASLTSRDIYTVLYALYLETGLVSTNEMGFPVWIMDPPKETPDRDSMSLSTVRTALKESQVQEGRHLAKPRVAAAPKEAQVVEDTNHPATRSVKTALQEAQVSGGMHPAAQRVTGCYRTRNNPFGEDNDGIRYNLMFLTLPIIDYSERFTACSLSKERNRSNGAKHFLTEIFTISFIFIYLFYIMYIVIFS